jgi:DNA-binding NtrC family response regulator
MKPNLCMLIIEDDKYTRLNLTEILGPFGVVEAAPDLSTAEKKLKENQYDVVITDIDLGKGHEGLFLITEIVRKGSYCIVVSSHDCKETIKKAYESGAAHFLSKFKLRDQLPVYIQKYLNLRSDKFNKIISENFITQDKDLMQELKKLCEINWKSQNLFISGPTGTGKSLLGKIIHEITHPEANLVHLNCAEVSENLLESELFGHEKGAFTGADQKKDGKLKLAHGGTLFLDEVATMKLSMQQKLLKAIDEKTFYPVGSTHPIKCEFTLITATCEDIQSKIMKQEFREDFYHRISGFQFHLKPLKDRSQDIELLLNHFQKKSSRRFVIEEDAVKIIKDHPWNGNIRELQKTCERLSQRPEGIIDRDIIRKVLGINPISSAPLINHWEEHVLSKGLKSFISSIEKEAVKESMKRNNGKITSCIKELKISSSAFYRILQEIES